MATEQRRNGGPDGRSERRGERRGGHRHGWRDDQEFWDRLGIDVESMSPRGQAATGAVTGGVILLAAALLLVFTHLWWLIFVFGWAVFPALGMFARGVGGLVDSSPRKELKPAGERERELLEALREKGELTPAQAAMETSLSVKEADDKLKELAEGGHLDVKVRGGGLFYSLWDYDKGPGEGGPEE